MRLPSVWLVSAVVIAVGLGGATGCANDTTVPAGAGPASPVPEITGPAFSATRVAALPTMLTGFGSTADGDQLIVGDRTGVVRRIGVRTEGSHRVPRLERRPLLDLHDRVSLSGERGFFDLKLVDRDQSLIVVFTELDGAIMIEQYDYSRSEPIDTGTKRLIARLPWPFSWHHGGGLALDSAGNLLLGLGDEEFRGFGTPGSQDPELLLGGILRIPKGVLTGEVDDWVPSPATDLIAKGFRNPWRVTTDRATGDVWIGEVGLDHTEEIDHIPAADVGTRIHNFGWPYLEGEDPYQKGAPTGATFDPPVFTRAHTPMEQRATDRFSVCGIVGGYVYRGAVNPPMQGQYLYGDLCGAEVRALTLRDGAVTDDRRVVTLPETVISLGEDGRGTIYALGSQGGLYRLDPPRFTGRDSSQTAPTVATTTTVARSANDCEGVVKALQPLSETGSMSPTELKAAIDTAQADLAEAQLKVPDFLQPDVAILERGLDEIERRLAEAGYSNTSADISSLRTELLEGTGAFEGYADAFARVIDSECK